MNQEKFDPQVDLTINLARSTAKSCVNAIDALPFDGHNKSLILILTAAYLTEINRASMPEEARADFDAWQANAAKCVRDTLAPGVAQFEAARAQAQDFLREILK